MAGEQADSSALESNSLSDLASFLDQPETESIDENEDATAEESTGEPDNETEANDDSNDESDDSEESNDDVEATPVETKVTFKVKNANGDEETVEATTEEIAKSYMRQQDYSRKTQALAERESQAVEFLKNKHNEVRNQYLSQAELTRTALVQMAGLKTGEEMAQLAHSDPAAWVAENQRQQSVNAYLNQLDRQINGEKQRAAQEAEAHRAQSLEQQFKKTWEVLEKEKIDKPALAKIYEGVNKTYGFSPEELGNVYDHRLVRMMRDAQAYQALKSQKADVTRKVTDAPRMPNRQMKQPTRLDAALENKFKSGRAKLNDLAAYLR